MIDNSVLTIKDVTKEYKLYDSEMDRLKEAFNPFHKSYHKVFHALNGINIDVKKGEKVGIIGANGAGKSTLLKLITGVLKQTSGDITLNGKVAALLELGAGFNPNYTGIENIRLNCRLMGFTPDQIEENIQRIIEFADIGDFVYQPVKLYSSGMFVRLAFATQIFSDPDILIVDEALSVGDIRFQQKCFRAMDNLMKDKTVILVTHDTAAVTRFCNRAIWMDKGQVQFDGDVDEALKKYKEFLINESIAEKEVVGVHDYDAAIIDEEALQVDDAHLNISIPPIDPSIKFKGNHKAKITACGLFDKNGKIVDVVNPGEEMSCLMKATFEEEASHPIVGMTVRDRLGNEIIAYNSQILGIELPAAKGTQEFDMRFVMPELNQGQYTITLAVANGFQQDHIQLCWADDAILFRIADKQYDVPGVLYIEKGEINTYQVN